MILPAFDMPEYGSYSIEEAKQKHELDLKIEAAEKKKDGVRKLVENLRSQYDDVRTKNIEIVKETESK